jgi:hypothetical protein
MLRSNTAKLALIAVLAVARFAATPAFGQSFSTGYGTGNVLPLNSPTVSRDVASHQASVPASRRTGVNSFAMAPRAQSQLNSDSPAETGGGSIGYNENLYNY